MASDDMDMEEQDEASILASLLAARTRDQDDLARDIGRQADTLLVEQADERDKKRLEKSSKQKEVVLGLVRSLEAKLKGFGNHVTKEKWREDRRLAQQRAEELERDLEQIQKRMDERHKDAVGAEGSEKEAEQLGKNRLPGESHRDFLIRTGKITPFSNIGRHLLKTSSSLAAVLLDAEEEGEVELGPDAAEDEDEAQMVELGPKSRRNLLAPGFDQQHDTTAATTPASTSTVEDDEAMARRFQDDEFANLRPAKRRRLQTRRQQGSTRAESEEANTPVDDSHAYQPPDDDTTSSADDAVPDDEELDLPTEPGIKRKKAKSGKTKAAENAAAGSEDLAGIDDGNEEVYQARLRSWVRRRRAARQKVKESQSTPATNGEAPGTNVDAEIEPEQETENDRAKVEEEKPEWEQRHPTRTDTVFEAGFRIPGDIYPSLFDYQKTGVQWLWELYSQQVGGIVGDEMGLGKTVQVISFLAGLHYSGLLTKPIIIVCPATVMKQWVNEFHRWWPPLRVSILHTSGSGMLDVGREARIEDELEHDGYRRSSTQSKGHKSAKRIVDRVIRHGHVLVTTYSGLQTYAELLIPTDWEYAVLDEGHKIRNPNTAITIYCKELRTHNRVILSGTPMQNNLTELWSLFDFVFPMRLGTLVNFRNQFDIPIKQGGYANASNLQVETAMKCAETLKDTISPYLLQRFKVDVAADLPKKSERVLFCKLTKLQRDAYEWFLASDDMKSILAGKRQALYGVDILRKICNHPDLVEHKTLSKKAGYAYGDGRKSGKMQVVKALLEIWKRNGHKTLLFAQHRIMLDILENFVRAMPGFKYRRMDGNTSIRDRQDLVDEFNRDPSLHVFLLTTKVGGLGVNLTGADRVIIYDPDWNPSTDVQARERAWRLGQKREVEIYRLMTAGTIEEKIYHRQIFKQFLTNKILRDPKQRQTFQLRDLHDLFTLGLGGEGGETETGSIFKGTEVRLSGGTRESGGQGQGRSLPRSPDEGEKRPDEGVGEVTGVSRQEDYRGNADEEQPQGDGEDGKAADNDRVLGAIFSRTGVQSALEHDAIINGRKTVRSDPEIIAREARRVAAEAAKELQRAGEIARTVPAGVPTWTGTVGSFGRPEERAPTLLRSSRGAGMRGRGGPSSAAIMANLASRQLPASPRADTPSRTIRPATAAAPQPKGKDFLILIRDFLVAQGGRAYTQMLIDHFNRYCGTPQRTAEFKEMLKTIAELEKMPGRGGRGRWVLRDEWKAGAM